MKKIWSFFIALLCLALFTSWHAYSSWKEWRSADDAYGTASVNIALTEHYIKTAKNGEPIPELGGDMFFPVIEKRYLSADEIRTKEYSVERLRQHLPTMKKYAEQLVEAKYTAIAFAAFFSSLFLSFAILQRKVLFRDTVYSIAKMIPRFKTCPYCAERVKEEAVACKHCGRDLHGKISK